MNPLIAFTGLAGCGKTTAAELLVEHHGYARLSFADPLRAMLVSMGVHPADLARKSTPLPILCGKTPREALQTLGTEWGRETIGGDIWVNAIRERIIRIGRGRPIVIDDCRFNNEATMVHALGGIVIAIKNPSVRPSPKGIRPALQALIDGNSPIRFRLRLAWRRLFTHKSERGVSPELVSDVILNDGDLESLLARVMEVAK